MARVIADVYTRESKGNPESVERQREDGVRLVEQRGWTLGLILGDDDKSAAGKRNRRDFDTLIGRIESGVTQAAVAWSWDRLERNRRDGLRLIEACQPRDVIVALVRGSDIDMSTPAGRMTADILASVARHEIEQKSDRMDRALLQAAEAGKPPTRRAFGYTEDGMHPHPIEAPAVAEAFARLLAGGSIVGITRWLNDNELWTSGGKPWTPPGVRKLIRNARYAAIRTYKGHEIGSGVWPPLVPEEVYRAAVDTLNDPGRRSHDGGHARKHLGAALYLCGRCADDNVVTTMATAYRIYQSPGYGIKKIRAYQCRASKHLSRVAQPVDAYVEGVIAGVIRKHAPAILARQAPDLTPLRTEAAALRKRIDALADDIALPESVLARRVRALEERLDQVKARLSQAGRTSALASLAGAEDPGRAWLEEPDIAVRQAVVRELGTVTLLPAPGGRRVFDASTVRFDPRGQL